MMVAPAQRPVPAPKAGAVLAHLLHPYTRGGHGFLRATRVQAASDARVRQAARGSRTHRAFLALQRRSGRA
jgi:hypothetical protein